MEMKSDESVLKDDPFTNAVYLGIKEDIKTLLDAKRFRGTLLLTYAGIDCMASIGMPEGQEDVTRNDSSRGQRDTFSFPGSIN